MAGNIRFIEDVEEAAKSRDDAWFRAASADCLRLGHEWWELETKRLGGGPALYCWRCIRVKLGGAEFWPGIERSLDICGISRHLVTFPKSH